MARGLYDTYTRSKSKLMFFVCTLFTVLILVILALVIGYLVSIGFKSLSWAFFTEEVTGDMNHPGGMKHAIVGTGVLLALASLVGVPLGVLVGIHLSEYPRDGWLTGPVRFICDVLAGVPSIVVGILGYELLVVPLGGFNGYAGAMALAFIMVPIVARTTEEMLRLVPNSYREASIALGATKTRTIFKVVLPAATGSLVTGIMLAIARVAGETAPLLFTALASRFVPIVFNGWTKAPSVHLDKPFPSLTQQIYEYARGPYVAQRNLAWAGIIVLISLIFVLNLTIRYFASRTAKMSTAH